MQIELIYNNKRNVSNIKHFKSAFQKLFSDWDNSSTSSNQFSLHSSTLPWYTKIPLHLSWSQWSFTNFQSSHCSILDSNSSPAYNILHHRYKFCNKATFFTFHLLVFSYSLFSRFSFISCTSAWKFHDNADSTQWSSTSSLFTFKSKYFSKI